MSRAPRFLVGCLVILVITGSARGQFIDNFDNLRLDDSRSGIAGWSFFTGDGAATMDLATEEEGSVSIRVDATRDRRNIWWALIKREVSDDLDLELLGRPGRELRIEARIRTSHAPRRVNLHVNTQRTTDFHSHLMEFDIAEAGVWQTISMTTRDFPAEPGDTVFAQMALMDWGRDTYRIDVDSFRVDVVEAASAGGDSRNAVPYHPPVPDPSIFDHKLVPSTTAVVDLTDPSANLDRWSILDGNVSLPVLTVNGAMWVILRWDLEGFVGQRVTDHGLLELTTHSVQRDASETKDSGLVRVVEIIGGDPDWDRATVTLETLLRGGPVDEVFNPQMIIDLAVNETPGGATLFSISRPVIQRLIDGTTRGLAIKPLGPVNATFQSQGVDAPRLLFNTKDDQGGQ